MKRKVFFFLQEKKVNTISSFLLFCQRFCRWIVIITATVSMRVLLFPLLVLQLNKLKRISELLPKCEFSLFLFFCSQDTVYALLYCLIIVS